MEVKAPIDLTAFAGARWFAGKQRGVVGLTESDAAVLPGGHGRIAIVEVTFGEGGRDRYLVGEGPGGELPAGAGVVAAVVDALRGGPLATAHGRLELRAGPALAGLASGPGAPEAVPSTDQSNTLVTLDDRLLVKVYRRLERGMHPEVELLASLAGTTAPVPAFAGSVHHVAADGADTAVMLLQEFVPAAEAGWEAPIQRAAALLREGGDVRAAAEEYAAAGRTAAALHHALAAVHGLSVSEGAGARLQAAAEAALTEAAEVDHQMGAAAAGVRARLAPLATAGPLTVGRVHGDLHYAQFLRSPAGLRVVDFEGDPTAPLAARRAPAPPLHDLACLLRSIDHIGSAAARRTGRDASAFVSGASAAALAAYEDEAGEPVDQRLLGALEVAKGMQELVYAHRVEPAWAYAPRTGLRRLLARSAP